MVLAVILNRRNSPLTSRGWCFCRKRGYIHRRRARIKNIFRGPARAAAGWTLILIYQARSILFRRLRLFGNHPERPSTFFLLFSRRRPPLLKYPPTWNHWKDEDKPHVDITRKIRGVPRYDFCLIIRSFIPFSSLKFRWGPFSLLLFDCSYILWVRELWMFGPLWKI